MQDTLFSIDYRTSSAVLAQSFNLLGDFAWNDLSHASFPLRQQQSFIFQPEESLAIQRALALSVSSISGMQTHPDDPQSKDDYLSEDSGQMTASSTTSRKRSRLIPTDHRADTTDRMGRPSKSMRTGKHSQKRRPSGGFQGALSIRDINLPDNIQDGNYSNIGAYQKNAECLTAKQGEFVQQWFDTFAHSDSRLALSHESLSALATLIQARPQIVYEYISETYPSLSNTNKFPALRQLGATSLQEQQQQQPLEPYALATANAHLPLDTLSLVSKYINACRRPRPRTDGRRSVNTGPYRCTFGCGYRTKRAFDWRRHEETHEPQELWLCTFCSPAADGGGKKEPFLVSRKDKFLKHAKEAHKEWMPEKVLELSRVDYRPRGAVECQICGWKGEEKDGWDDRCRHVLGHFEDEVERGLGRPSILSGDRENAQGSGKGSVASGSDASGSVASGSVASGSVASGCSDEGECGTRDRDRSEGKD